MSSEIDSDKIDEWTSS